MKRAIHAIAVPPFEDIIMTFINLAWLSTIRSGLDRIVSRARCTALRGAIRVLPVAAAAIGFLIHGGAVANAQCTLSGPAQPTVTAQCSSIHVSWTGVPFAARYLVYRTIEPQVGGAEWTILSTNVSGTSYLDSTAVPNKTYYYFVQSACIQGTGGVSVPSNPVSLLAAPGIPQGVQASDGTSCAYVRVSWSAIGTATSYDVYRNTSSTQPSTPIANVPVSQYDDVSATPGTTYNYWVESRNACGASGPSVPNSGFRKPAPSTPGGVSASDGSSCNSILVTWSQVTGATSYRVFRNTVSNFASAGQVAQVPVSPFVDSMVNPGTVYYYWIVASNGTCEGSPSSSNSGYALAAPSTPGAVSAQVSGCLGVRVFWNASSNATSYTIYRGPNTAFQNASPIGTASASPYLDTVPGPGPYYYWVVGTNGCGSSAAGGPTIGTPIAGAPSITQGPQNTAACLSSSAVFSAAASGMAVSYQWYRNGAVIPGANAPSYSIASVTSQSAGMYHVVATNACGSDTSAAAQLVVLTPPTIVTPPNAQVVCAGAQATFSVVATSSGGATLTYQWTKNGAPLAGQTSFTLVLGGVGTQEAGSYAVVVSDGTCTVTSPSASLTVNTVPQINAQPASVSACPQATVLFSVTAQGGQLTYQWRKDGTPIQGANSATLSGTASALGTGLFDVLVSNSCGQTPSASATLTLQGPPAITTQPQDLNLCEGRPFVLCTKATGSTPLVYSWFRNGVPISGANTSCYSVAAATPAHAGNYRVDVSNSCGLVSSTVVTVTVTPLTAGVWSSLSNATDGEVLTVITVQEPNGPAIYAAGRFTQIGGISANNIARFDGTNWQPLGAGTDGAVRAMVLHDDGQGTALYVGGAFTSAGGLAANKIACWTSSTWSPLGSGITGPKKSEVFALASFDDGSGPALWAGGSFSNARPPLDGRSVE